MSLRPSCDPYNELSSARNCFSNLHLFLFQPNFSEWPTLLLTVNRRSFLQQRPNTFARTNLPTSLFACRRAADHTFAPARTAFCAYQSEERVCRFMVRNTIKGTSFGKMHIIGVLWVTNAALYAVAPLDLCNDAKRLTPWLFAVHRSLPIHFAGCCWLLMEIHGKDA